MIFYPRLFENPNAVYIPKENRAKDWSDTYTIPFSYYGKKLYVGVDGQTHDEMIDLAPKNYEGDGRGKCSGRLFLKEKIITFWHFPENKEALKKLLSELQNNINNDSDRDERVDFENKQWRIEIPKEYNKLKNYPKGGLGNYPKWGSWYPKKEDQTFVKIEKYNKKYERSKEELEIRHLIPPGAGKKPVSFGFGSKSPNYLSKRKWQMATVGDESKKEQHYPRLFEHPDWINIPGDKEVSWDKDGTYAFGIFNNKLYISKERATHGSIEVTLNDRPYFPDRKDFKYAGRIWTKEKFISFWKYPRKSILFKIIRELEKDLNINIIDDIEWKIDVPTDKNDVYSKGKQIHLSKYIGKPREKHSAEDLARQHNVSPLLKPKRKVPFGFGSKNPKYLEHRQWQMAMATEESENYYPKLSEILNEMSISVIKPYISMKSTSLILLNEVDDDIIEAVDSVERDDYITKDIVDKAALPSFKNNLNNFLITKGISIDDLDNETITFGEFWDYQVELAKNKESDIAKKNARLKSENYYFTPESIETLNNFYAEHEKGEQFKQFVDNIPNGLIRQPLNELFTIMCKIVNEETTSLVDEIKGRKLNLNKQDQNQWKEDMIKYLYSFNEIDELNQNSFYQEQILKPETFINTLMYIDEKGVGRGELLLCYLYEGATAQGGGTSYDVVLLNGKKYEVKEYLNDKGGIRLGTEAKLTRFPFWRNIQKTVDIAGDIMTDYEQELKESISDYFFRMWKYVVNDKREGDSFNKTITAGVRAGELSTLNLNILKMWYYLAHELIVKSEYEKSIISDDVISQLTTLKYVNNPEQLDLDLENVSLKYFEDNEDLDAFIVFRPFKANIVEKGGFAFNTITQAAVKFLETDLSKKSVSAAKTAFLKWKQEMQKSIEEFDSKKDQKALKDILNKTYYRDFFKPEISIPFKEKHKTNVEKEYETKHKRWENRYKQMLKSIQKFKRKETQDDKKIKWLNRNPEPVLETYKNISEKFIQDSDPIADMGIGMKAQLKKWIETETNYIYNENDLLWICAEAGKTEFVKYLLDAGADVHAIDDYALRWASNNGHADVVKLLLDAGADVHADNDHALQLASYNGHTDVVNILKNHIAKEESII